MKIIWVTPCYQGRSLKGFSVVQIWTMIALLCGSVSKYTNETSDCWGRTFQFSKKHLNNKCAACLGQTFIFSFQIFLTLHTSHQWWRIFKSILSEYICGCSQTLQRPDQTSSDQTQLLIVPASDTGAVEQWCSVTIDHLVSNHINQR